jgi:N-acetylmuramic acid 6-phosphate etherase
LPLAIRDTLSKKVFFQIEKALTEQRNPRTFKIDTLPTLEILKLINTEDHKPALAVRKELKSIARAVELVTAALKKGGRLFYLGAGTSGRLGVLDAAECPPTFGTDPKQIRGVIAGGYRTLIRSREGVEDNLKAGAADLRRVRLSRKDVVTGIAASKRTPYVLGGLQYAKRVGAKTVFIYCNPNFKADFKADVEICPKVGPEVITGSTRMKAGTAQKMVLNLISTAAMIKLGKVYQNLMVDLRATSQKLVERSKRTIMLVTGVSYSTAEKYLKSSGGSVKTALVMILAKLDKKEAEKRLQKAQGFVRTAIESR